MANLSHLKSNGIILLKRPYISLIIATRGLKCENNFKKVMAWESFPIADFDLWLLLQCQVVSSYYKGLISPLFPPYITDPKAGDNCCGRVLVFLCYCISVSESTTRTILNNSRKTTSLNETFAEVAFHINSVKQGKGSAEKSSNLCSSVCTPCCTFKFHKQTSNQWPWTGSVSDSQSSFCSAMQSVKGP